jgi:hypothetical protein
MKDARKFLSVSANLLTLLSLLFVAGCAPLFYSSYEQCNSRAYLKNDIPAYIKSRYHSGAPVRMAVIPFSTPANLAARNNELPGMGNELAWKIRNELISTGEIPMVEVLNRSDWPRKKEEYHLGNFGALGQARAAGYDLVLVGKVENLRSMDSLTANVKVIEVDTGITLWSGESQVTSDRRYQTRRMDPWGGPTYIPSQLNTNLLIDEMAGCVRETLLREDVLPG